MSQEITRIEEENAEVIGKLEQGREEIKNQEIIENSVDIKELKEKNKDIKKFSTYLDECKVNKENFELLNYLDSSADSNIFSINIIYKNKNGQKMKKKAVMKSIFYKKRENKKEIIISSKLKNPNVINFYAYSPIKKGQSYFFAMEDAKYGNLRNFQKNILKRNILSESWLCFLSRQILDALNYCHKCKIAHMDLKLQNVVIDDYLNAKLIDFSISINYQNKKPNEELKLPFKGTNFYMAKEVLQSDKIKYKDLQKVDLYSLGVILYNLAFGKYPYGLTYEDQYDYYEILQKIKRNELDFNNNLNYSRHFLDFLKSLLEKDLGKRIGLNQALEHYWIKGADLLNEEKEKCYKMDIFVSYLLTDHIKSFNEYLSQ